MIALKVAFLYDLYLSPHMISSKPNGCRVGLIIQIAFVHVANNAKSVIAAVANLFWKYRIANYYYQVHSNIHRPHVHSPNSGISCCSIYDP